MYNHVSICLKDNIVKAGRSGDTLYLECALEVDDAKYKALNAVSTVQRVRHAAEHLQVNEDTITLVLYTQAELEQALGKAKSVVYH